MEIVNTVHRTRCIHRTWWAAIGAAVAVTLGAGGIVAVNAAASAPASIITIDPVRILDTRSDLGLSGPFVSPVSQKLQVTGSAVPVGATGVLLNVTAVRPTADGFISVRPGDLNGAPSTSSLNFAAGTVTPNSVQVGLPTTGANVGQVDIAYDAFGVAGPQTEVLVDVVGYLTTAAGGPAGPTGTPGVQGPAGPPGPVNVLWAKVDSDFASATLLAGSPGTSAAGDRGSYTVRFASIDSVANCGWTATLNANSSGAPAPGEITVELLSDRDPNTLVIRILNNGGVVSSSNDGDGFTVMVICP